jgi:hypothetical protein
MADQTVESVGFGGAIFVWRPVVHG